MYHRLTTWTGSHPYSLAVARFRAQLALLRRLGFHSISLLGLAEHLARGTPISPRAVVITFDDGYLDTLTLALPLLREFGFSATCYFVAGAIGRWSEWTKPAPLMDWDGVRAWLAAGMEVGSHSVSHRRLPWLDDAAVREEVVASKARLEDRLGIAVGSFAYPYNHVDERALAAVVAAGYAAACAGVGAYGSLWAIPRVDAAHESWARVALPLLRALCWNRLPRRTRGEPHRPAPVSERPRTT